jgi:hypothetical protein
VVTGASVILWSTAFNAKMVPIFRSGLLLASVFVPLIGFWFSRKMKEYNAKLIIYSNRIRDKHLGALTYNNPEIIPGSWQIYDVGGLNYKLTSWWNIEFTAYIILIGFGVVFFFVSICRCIRF